MQQYDGPYAFLLDAPSGEPRKRIQIAKLGKGFQDPRYGRFSITADEVQRWSMNLAKLPGGRAAIDLDHLADKPGAARRTEAAGWITGVTLEDGVPMADVEWTSLGEEAIKDKRYLFFSPSYGPWSDEQGTVHKDVLVGGALTNRPFLNMPTVSLSAHAEPRGDAVPNPMTFAELFNDSFHLHAVTLETAAKKGCDYETALGLLTTWHDAVALNQRRESGQAITLDQAREDVTVDDVLTHGQVGVNLSALDALHGEMRRAIADQRQLDPDDDQTHILLLESIKAPRGRSATDRSELFNDSVQLDAAAKAYALEHSVPYEQAVLRVVE